MGAKFDDMFANSSAETKTTTEKGFVEGVAKQGQLTPVQAAFLDHFAFQCGYCTPGFVNQAQVLLESLARAPVPKAEVEAHILAAMDGHICRCTGYVRYYAALRDLILADPKLTR